MKELLLDNHLAFLRSHRGEVSRTSLGYTIQSERPEFTYGIMLEDGGVDPSLHVVHRPEIGRATAKRLEAQGFRPSGALRYMVRETTPLERTVPAPDIRTELASTQDDADIFSDVQTRGFFDREEHQREWLPFMRASARRNVHSPEQSLLLARLDGVPVGVTLTVETDVVGVYAVATPSAFRKRGVATALLDAALRRAAERGRSTTTLQVVVGSAAERLYTSLGFASQFTSEIWRR